MNVEVIPVRTDNAGQPTGGHRTSHRSPTSGYRGGCDTFCGGQRCTIGGRKIFPPVVHQWAPQNT